MLSSNKWSRRGAAATAAVLAASAVAAIGASASSAKSTVAHAASSSGFTVAAYGDSENSVEKYAVATYDATAEGKQDPATLETFPGADYQTKLQTIMSTSSAPDVFFNWGGGSILQFQKAGLLEPLNSYFAANPKLKSSFLPSILNAAKIGGNYYGIPMRGTQPVFVFYNKTLLKTDGVSVPKTFPQMLADVKKLKSKGVETPIALGGADQWPTLMWYEYLFDRVAGPSLVTNALAGDKAEWSSAASKKALADIKTLVKAGAFGVDKSWDSVYFTKNQTAAMLQTGESAFELMGSWDYSTIQSQLDDGSSSLSAQQAASKQENSLIGYTAFPSVPGGKGNLADLAGNTENYYSVLKSGAASNPGIADFLAVMYTPGFVKKELAIGNLTTTSNTKSLISGPTSAYLTWQYNLVNKAPAFQLSWDQAYPQTDTNTMHTAVANYFDSLNASQFIKAMQSLTPAS
jgi:xylobiose transport system substrate-binding protein